MQHRFTPTVLLLTGGLLIWLATFVLGYVFEAVACARGFAEARLGGARLVPLVVIALDLLAAAATVTLLLAARRRWRVEQQDAHGRFLRCVMLACCAIALPALWLLALPPLLVSRWC